MAAARRLVAAAPAHGIDLSLIWAVVEPRNPDSIRQLCLAVPSPGRTAMLFVSEPQASGDSGGELGAARDRAACLSAACRYFEGERAARQSARVVLAQGLPEPQDLWAIAAFEAAGFCTVGDLCYLRQTLKRVGRVASQPQRALPTGVELVQVSSIQGRDAQDRELVEALDSSYVDTMDCPELCGLRETRDVLESHRATGVWSAALWWIVVEHGRPRGCMLLSRCPELRSAELVYLGLAPSLRGRGVAGTLLRMGSELLASERDIEAVTCAVDLRNQPALRLYNRCGFRAIGERRAFVKPV